MDYRYLTDAFLREENVRNAQINELALSELEGNILKAIQTSQAENRQQLQHLNDAVNSKKFALSLHARRQAKVNSVKQWHKTNTVITQHLSQNLSSSVTILNESQISQNLLNSLSFYEMNDRYSQVSEAERRTFKWIYDTQPVGGPSNFVSWLTHSSASQPIFWIAGKPGSGKSTLMKYILDDAATHRLLKLWSGSREILVANCFFWASGSLLQKSQQGLLQTLLHQLLVKRRELTRLVFDKRWHILELGFDANYSWSQSELWAAIHLVLDRLKQDTNVLILLDGLDEFHGNDAQRQTFCESLRGLVKHPAIKICASSRPWNVYADAFREMPQIRLELLTKSDIQNYVEDVLCRNEHFVLWQREDPELSSKLVDTINHKAQGVFLWVRLVTSSLAMGLRNCDDTYELFDRLEAIPEDLEEYFERMLTGLDRFYLEQATQQFAMALRARTLLLTYYFHRLMNTPQGLKADSVRPMTLEDIRKLEAKEETRLNARSMGLLEATTTESSQCKSVDFMHRTARDFIASEPIQTRLRPYLGATFEVDQVVLRTLIYQLKSLDPQDPWADMQSVKRYIVSSMLLARTLLSQGKQVLNLISDFSDLFQSWSTMRNGGRALAGLNRTDFGDWYDVNTEQSDFLSLAITFDLEEYVLHVLKDWTRDMLHSKPGRPYLSYALCARDLDLPHRPPNLVIVTRLLELGADPKQVWQESLNWSVWGEYLDVLLAEQSTRMYWEEAIHDTHAEVVITMIKGGASLNPKKASRNKFVNYKYDVQSIFSRVFRGPQHQKIDTALKNVGGININTFLAGLSLDQRAKLSRFKHRVMGRELMARAGTVDRAVVVPTNRIQIN